MPSTTPYFTPPDFYILYTSSIHFRSYERANMRSDTFKLKDMDQYFHTKYLDRK